MFLKMTLASASRRLARPGILVGPWSILLLTVIYHNKFLVGFGIDFSSHSVFFTKNGKVVAEATKSTLENPIFNLKTLHATIGFAGFRECKVNLGSAPFEFDILRYQQEKSKTKLYSAATRLYSDVRKSCFRKRMAIRKFNFVFFKCENT